MSLHRLAGGLFTSLRSPYVAASVTLASLALATYYYGHPLAARWRQRETPEAARVQALLRHALSLQPGPTLDAVRALVRSGSTAELNALLSVGALEALCLAAQLGPDLHAACRAQLERFLLAPPPQSPLADLLAVTAVFAGGFVLAVEGAGPADRLSAALRRGAQLHDAELRRGGDRHPPGCQFCEWLKASCQMCCNPGCTVRRQAGGARALRALRARAAEPPEAGGAEAPPGLVDGVDDSPTCRFCFGTAGELVAPCACRGTVGFVHPHCLAAWQLTSLESRGERETDCRVCQQPFAAPPPPLGALMRCARCYAAVFCSKACQAQDWPRHKLVCRPRPPPVPPAGAAEGAVAVPAAGPAPAPGAVEGAVALPAQAGPAGAPEAAAGAAP